jgi:predicted signal transduction protein with EAL and GGDEF domain
LRHLVININAIDSVALSAQSIRVSERHIEGAKGIRRTGQPTDGRSDRVSDDLKRLPIDALKIDSSFIRDVAIDRDDAMIVQAIIGLARNLRLKVIGEGVESKDQLRFLRQNGCDEAQGYLFGRPVCAADFEANYMARVTSVQWDV